jgi:hypothetical protein
MWIWMLALIGCGGPAECGVAECADVCAKASPAPEGAVEGPAKNPAQPAPKTGAAGLSSFEQELVNPILEDVRKGVRPFGDNGVGICTGSGKECSSFLGLSPGELPKGTHMVRAELAVPKGGERGTWKVSLDVECTTTKTTKNGSSTSTNNYNKSYDVVYAGKDRGFRLQPLYKIESPNKGGARDCKYKITAPHPDAEDTVWSGSWTVPGTD